MSTSNPGSASVQTRAAKTQALDNLELLPRLSLAVTPTPVVRLAALERALLEELGRPVPAIVAKLDAYTGFGLGGNKVRKLEYVLARERLGGVTHLITAGGVQSNHCRVTAVAAARRASSPRASSRAATLYSNSC